MGFTESRSGGRDSALVGQTSKREISPLSGRGGPPGGEGTATAEELYLDLLKKCLTRYAFPEKYRSIRPTRRARRMVFAVMRAVLAAWNLDLVRPVQFDPDQREQGEDWPPPEAETMIGLRRLDNLQSCIIDVLRRRVPGDLIETGVWRGGATIFMRAVLKAYKDRERVVWVADSFEGLPEPNPDRLPPSRREPSYRQRWNQIRAATPWIAIPLEEVKANFARYALLDTQVQFLVGWFHETLPRAPIDRLAVLRLDGDMYESTMDALTYLYPKLSVGGYTIIDDYGQIPACRMAVDDFRAQHGIDEELWRIDRTSVFWQRHR
jgi:O-methyltransferase